MRTNQLGGIQDRDITQRVLKNTAKVGIRRIGALTTALRPLPDFLILGGQRCGTSSLYRYLCDHPFVRRAFAKEVHYFDLHFDAGEAWYRSHFPMTFGGRTLGGAVLTGEATPYYLFHPLVPARVATLLPDARFIVLLRDPVERVISHYHHETSIGFERRSLAQALADEPQMIAREERRLRKDGSATSKEHQHFSYFTRGLYARQLEAWFAEIPRDRFLILGSERLFRSPSVVYEEVLRFLDLPLIDPPAFARANGGSYGKPEGDEVAWLRELYEPYDVRLSELLGEDLGWKGSGSYGDRHVPVRSLSR